MRHFFIIAALMGSLAATSAQAAQDRPITSNDPSAIDVAKTPMTDLNLEKTEIPPVLIAAIGKPYDLHNLKGCKQLTAAVEELNGILGPDVDLPQDSRDRVSTGRVAKWVVGSFIPFRGLIREISGANAQERAVVIAIQAGFARRGFLKGVGAERGCKYPASPATPAIIQAHVLRQQSEDAKAKPNDKAAADTRNNTSGNAPGFTSQPVVQKVP